jgi:GDP-L-fucose synthase
MKLKKYKINKKKDKIFLFGDKGLIGSAIYRCLVKKGYKKIFVFSKKKINLLNQEKVFKVFNKHKPKYVIIAAARVGGILANSNFPFNFIYENLSIQNNIILASAKSRVSRLIFLGSSCIYPSKWNKPFKEEDLTLSKLEKTNEPYSIAKIAGLNLCHSYNRQFNNKNPKFITIIPPNLFGPNDNYNQFNSHVLAALLRKFYLAKKNNIKTLSIWGNGKSRREFMHSDDVASIIVKFLEISQKKLLFYTKGKFSHFNVGSGRDYKISEIVEIIKKVSNFKGKIIYDRSYPNGVKRKLLSDNLLKRVIPGTKKMKLQNKNIFSIKIQDVFNSLNMQLLKKFEKNSSYNLPG